jgi:hypothetical protein
LLNTTMDRILSEEHLVQFRDSDFNLLETEHNANQGLKLILQISRIFSLYCLDPKG